MSANNPLIRNDRNIISVGISDIAVQVNLLLSLAPKGMLIREALQNGVEAFVDRSETVRRIWIRPVRIDGFDARKLSILNTGRGMTATELKKITNINGSLKRVGTKTLENRGEGIKVSAARYNPVGTRWRSRLDGIISEVWLVQKSDGSFGRLAIPVEYEDDGRVIYVESYPINDPEHPEFPQITDQELAYYNGIEGDWNEVVFFGNASNHDTFCDPYGEGVDDDQFIFRQIQNRYFERPTTRSGIPVEINYQSDEIRASLGIYGDAIKFPREIIDADKALFRTEVVPIANGLSVEFIHGIELKARKQFPTRGAVVSSGEQYSVRPTYNWQYEVQQLGMPGLGTYVSVILHVPEEMAQADRYRGALMDTNLTIEGMSKEIVDARPIWVKKMLGTERTPNLDVTKDLEQLLERFKASKALHGNIRVESSSGGTTRNKPRPESDNPPTTTTTNIVKGAPNPQGKAKVKMLVPQTEWLRNSANQEGLKDRIAVFADDGKGGTIYLNSTAPFLNDCVNELLYKFLDPRHAEITRAFVKDQVRYQIAYKIGALVLAQNYRRGTASWDDEAYRRSVHPDSLFAAISMFQADIPEFAKLIRKMPDFKQVVAKGVLESDPEATEVEIEVSAVAGADLIAD